MNSKRDVLVQHITRIWIVKENTPMVLVFICLLMSEALIGIVTRKDKRNCE